MATFCKRRQMRKEIEALEHEAEFPALQSEPCLAHRLPARGLADIAAADRLAGKRDLAAGRRFEMVETAQDGGLAGSRRTDEHQGLSGHQVEGNALEDLALSIALAQVADREQRLVGRRDGLAHNGHHAGRRRSMSREM